MRPVWSATSAPRYASIDPRVAPHLIGCPDREDTTLAHHDDRVAPAHHDIHVVLDQEDRRAAFAKPLDVVHERMSERAIHAGERLVEQQQSRFEHERPGQLEQLPLPAGKRPCVVLRLGA